MSKGKQWVHPRHQFYHTILRRIPGLYFRFKYNFHYTEMKLGKEENALVISNHQTDLDPIMVSQSYNKNIYYVATDTLFSNPLTRIFLNHMFAPIPKRKGATDATTIRNILKVRNEKGCVGLFVEGNRSYAEFVYHIDMSIVKLIRKLEMPVIFHHISGGTGTLPRFGAKSRTGRIDSGPYNRLEKKDYDQLTDEELLQIIKENVCVFDSDSGVAFKSERRAEYLERMMFVCPQCKGIQTLHSKGNLIKCEECGCTAEYTEDLHIKMKDSEIPIHRLIDWYELQKDVCRTMDIDENPIFTDENVCLYSTGVNKKRKLLYKGKIELYKDRLEIGEYGTIAAEEIQSASPLSGTKIVLVASGNEYIIKGDERFNPLKYVLMFHRLETGLKGNDKYFALENE